MKPATESTKTEEEQPKYFLAAFVLWLSVMLFLSAITGIGNLLGDAAIWIRAVAGLIGCLGVTLVFVYLSRFEDEEDDIFK